MSGTIILSGYPAPEPRTRDLWGLAAFEGRRLLRHPLFLVFAGLTGLFIAIFFLETADDRDGVVYEILAGTPVAFMPLATGVFMASNMAASRSRHDGTDELFAPMPAGPVSRTMAQLLAVAWAVALTGGLVVAGFLISGAWSGLPVAMDTTPGTISVDYPPDAVSATDVTPSIVELLQAPLAVAVFGLAGVALAVWVRTRLILLAVPVMVMVHLVITSWSIEVPWRWQLPFVSVGQGVGWVEVSSGGTTKPVVQGFNVAAAGWHDVYLVGLILLLVGVSLLRYERTRRVAAAVGSGIVLAAVGTVSQLATYTPSL